MKRSVLYILILLLAFNLNAQKITKQAPWQQKTNYDIKVTLNPVIRTLDARISIQYFNNSPDTLKSIWLHVWPNAYSNTQTAYALQELKNGNTDFQFSAEKDKGHIEGFHFKLKNDTLKWHFDSIHIDILEVILHEPLLPGSNLTITTPFKVKLPNIFSRSGSEGNFFAITQWYPKPAVYDVNGWNTMPYLNQGEFYSEFGDFSVSMCVPKKYMVASTGNLISERDTILNDSLKFKLYAFNEKNIHDFAWFASPDFLIQRRTISIGNGDSVQLNYYEYTKDIEALSRKKANSNLTWPIERALLEYGKKVGRYPYRNCSVVIGKLVAGGGMEYPTITVCSSADDETIIHEVGHNWFYGMLGTNERQYPWMDESINTFYEQKISGRLASDSLFYKNFKGKNWLKNYGTLTGYLFSASQGVSQPLNLSSEEFTNLNYGSIVYCKGPLLFAYLEEQLGDSVFQQCMMNYFIEWQYRHPLPQNIQNSFQKTCGRNLDWFFKDLLNENNQTDIVKTKSAIHVKGSVKLDSFLNGKTTTNPNPFGFLPESNYLNNGQKLKLLTLNIPFHLPRQNARIAINLAPAGGYNYYDKFYLGAILFNRTIYRKKFEYVLMPAYAVGSKKMVGYGQMNYLQFSKNKNLFKTEVGIKGQSFGLALLNNLNQYYRLNPYIRFHLKHKGKIDEMMDKQLHINYYHTGLRNTSYLAYQDSNQNNIYLNYPSANFFNYYKLSYLIDYKHPVNAVTFKVSAEYGANYKFEPLANRYIKTWINAAYKYTYDRKNKYFKTEFFAGLFIAKKGTTSTQQFYLSSNNGAKDYVYNEAMLGRNENAYSDNLLGRQIINTNGNMRNTIPLNSTDKWMLSLINDVSLPGIIPLRIYADFGYYPYTKISNTSTGTLRESIAAEIYTTMGITIPFFKETLEIFVPLYRSKQFLKYSNYNYSFMNSIGFKLNLNKLQPFKLIDNYRP